MTLPLAIIVRAFFAPAATKACCRSVIFTTPRPPTLSRARTPRGSRTSPGPRVCLAIHIQQLRGVDVRVALRRGQLHVAEQFLDGAQVGAALEQMRRKGMSQRVRTDPEARAAHDRRSAPGALHASPGQSGARGNSRTADPTSLSQPTRAVLQPDRNRLLRRVVERDDSFLGPLSHHANHARAQVHVLDVEANELAEPESGRVEQLEHRTVAAAERLALVRGVSAASTSRPPRDAPGPSVLPWGSGQRNGVAFDPSLAAHVARERPQRRELARHRRPCLPLPVQVGHERADRRKVDVGGLELAGLFSMMRRSEGEKLREVAVVRRDGVRRYVAIQPEKLKEGPELFFHRAIPRGPGARVPPWRPFGRPFSPGPAEAGHHLGRRHDAEGNVRRLVGARVGVRHVIAERADRRRPRRRRRLFAKSEGRRVAPGNQSRRRGLDVALDAGNLAGEEQIGPGARLPRFTQYGRSVDVRVAMHHAEAHELGVLETGNQRQHARLFTPLQLRLEPHQAEMVAGQIVLPQLHDGKRRAPGARIGQADRLHRAEPQGVAPAMCHHLDWKTALEELLLVEIMDGGGFGADQRLVKPAVFALRHRAVEIVALAIVHATLWGRPCRAGLGGPERSAPRSSLPRRLRPQREARKTFDRSIVSERTIGLIAS